MFERKGRLFPANASIHETLEQTSKRELPRLSE